jgi:electron transfer DM13
VLLTVGLVLFEPWTLFVDDRVDEAVPVSTEVEPTSRADGTEPSIADTTSNATAAVTKGPASKAPVKEAKKTKQAKAIKEAKATPTPTGPVTLLKGSFISHEHGTSGRVEVLELKNGSRVLRIKGLDTSNGPDLRVWLTDAPVRKGRAGWFNFDDGRHIDLGALKGNLGNQNYAVPADADLDTLRSVSIWCARFRVSFGAAALT